MNKYLVLVLAGVVLCGCSPQKDLTGQWEMRRQGRVELIELKENQGALTGFLKFTPEEPGEAIQGKHGAVDVSFEYSKLDSESNLVHVIYTGKVEGGKMSGVRVSDMLGPPRADREPLRDRYTNSWIAVRRDPNQPISAEAKIAALEERISQLETNLADTATALGNLTSITKEIVLTNALEMAQLKALVQQEQAHAPVRYVAPRSSAPITKDGVPIAIYNQIAEDAATSWPGNYEMQAFVIKEQIAAFLKLHP